MSPLEWIVSLILLAKLVLLELACSDEGLNIVELVMCAVLK